MNYLAHSLLSKKHIDYQLGNLLADPLKGKAWKGCNQYHLQGIAMHKAIDKFTDENLYVKQAKSRLGHGYLKGVVTDILFDHFLTRHWEQFVDIDFEEFVQNFYHLAEQRRQQLPPIGKQFIDRLIRYDFFHLYGDMSSLAKVFQKFDQRLSPRLLTKDRTSHYLPVIQQQYDAIEADFLQFFPTLIILLIQKEKLSANEHYFYQPSPSNS